MDVGDFFLEVEQVFSHPCKALVGGIPSSIGFVGQMTGGVGACPGSIPELPVLGAEIEAVAQPWGKGNFTESVGKNGADAAVAHGLVYVDQRIPE